MKFPRFRFCILLLIAVLIFSAVPVSATEASDPAYAQSLEEAAAILRDGMKRREETVTLTLKQDLGSFNGTNASAEKLADEIVKLAYAHTGVPTEGDYLRFAVWYVQPIVDFLRQSDGWELSMTFQVHYYANAQQEAELDKQIEELVQELKLKSDLTDYQKVSAIYHYICSAVEYDYDNLENDEYILKFSTYAAQVNKIAVCQGYTTLFYRLALEAGLDNRVVTGEAINAQGETESHAWNLVLLDADYYYLDATWDAQSHEYQWFLKSAEDMIDHKLDPEYTSAEFCASYPVAPKSYQHPDLDHAVSGDYEYMVTSGAAAILRYTGTEADVTVPAMLDGYPVYWIASGAICDNPHIRSITFSEGIRILESEAIGGCANLKSIHLPSTIDYTASKVADYYCRVVCSARECPSVETITVAEENPNLIVHDGVLYTKDMSILRYYPAGDPREIFEIPEGVLSIGSFAFVNSQNLNEIKMPNTVRLINDDSFSGCTQLKKINLSNNCRMIGQHVFSDTALESIHIPASVEQLFGGSFGFHCMLKTITVDPDNPFYYVVDNVLYGNYVEGKQTDSCHIPGKWLVKYPAGSDATSFTVPEDIVGIEQNAFAYSTTLQEIILPDSLYTIYNEAFWGCSGLLKLELPEKLKKIYDVAFSECTGLVDLVIPASVEQVGYYAFDDMNLENLVFLGDAPEMWEHTFIYSGLDIYYPAGNATWEEPVRMYSGFEGVQWNEACESHQFESVTKEPGCVTVGYEGQKCSVCGLVKLTGKQIPAKGHDLVDGVKVLADCENPAGIIYHCSVCQEEFFEETAPALGHNYVNGVCTNCTPENGIKSLTPHVVGSAKTPEAQKEVESSSAPDKPVTLIIASAAAGVILIAVVCVLLRKKAKRAKAE